MRLAWSRGELRRRRPRGGALLVAAFLFVAPAPGAIGAERSVRGIRSGETHRYQFQAQAGDYVRVRVEGQRLDAGARIVAPDGARVAESLRAHEPRETESLEILAGVSGTYSLEIRDLRHRGWPGRYRWQIEQNPANDEDRLAVRARALACEADRLYLSGRAEDLESAARRLEEAFGLWKQMMRAPRQPDLAAQVQAAHLLARVEERQGRGDEALARYAEAESWRIRLSSSCRRPVTIDDRCPGDLLPIGRRHLLDLHEQFLGFLDAADSIVEHPPSAEDDLQRAVSLSRVGRLSSDLGDWDEALASYREALELARRSRSAQAQAGVLHNLGLLYLALGAHEESLASLRKALPLWKRTGEFEAEAATLVQISSALLAGGRRREALRHAGRALTLAREGRDVVIEGNALAAIADVHAALGEPRRALDSYERARRLKHGTRDRLGEALADLGLGRVSETLGSLDQAQVAFDQALTFARRDEIPAVEAEALFGLARVARQQGRADVARERIQAAIALVEGLRGKIRERDLRASFFASVRAYYELYIDLIMEDEASESDPVRIQASFELNERSRARCLLESLASSRHRIRLDAHPDLLARLRQTEQALDRNAASRRLLGRDSRGVAEERSPALAREEQQLREQLEQTEAALRRSSPRYAALMDARHLTLREIQAQVLDPQTVLLQYALGDSRSYLWAVTPDTARCVRLPGRRQVERVARRLYGALTARNESVAGESAAARIRRWTRADAEYPALAAELSHMLLAPVYADLRGKRLLLVSDGILQYLPFAVLPAPDEARAPLLLRHEIVTAPSASAVAVVRRDGASRTPAPRAVAVLADPVFDAGDPRVHGASASRADRRTHSAIGDPLLLRSLVETSSSGTAASFPRLPFTRDEARRIGALVPEPERLTALDFAASRATAVGAALGGFRIVHFATHALVNSRVPARSGIVLSLVDPAGRPQDGFLRLDDIRNMQLSADLVALSACRTALGRDVHGEGLASLARGFMDAGTPRVLASLWRVDDRATSELMRRFYALVLGEGHLRPAAALRVAQQELQASERWRHPYYWAGFTLTGEWR